MTRITFGLAFDFASAAMALADRLEECVRLAQVGEEYGFESVWAGEWYGSTSIATHLPASFLTLAIMSARTSMSIGSGITLLPTWHPLRLAYDSALLDQLSGGRLIMGVGIGRRDLWTRFGDGARSAGVHADHYLAALKALWAGENGYQGAGLAIAGGIWPRPVRPEGIPLWVGGRARRAAERAAQFGEGWIGATNYQLDEIAAQAETYYEQCAAHGNNPGAISVNRICGVAGTTEQAWRDLGSPLEELLSHYARRGDITGIGPDLPGPLRHAVSSGIVLVGSPDQVNENIARYAAAGVTHLQLRIFPEGVTATQATRSLRLLGEEVLPVWHHYE